MINDCAKAILWKQGVKKKKTMVSPGGTRNSMRKYPCMNTYYSLKDILEDVIFSINQRLLKELSADGDPPSLIICTHGFPIAVRAEHMSPRE